MNENKMVKTSRLGVKNDSIPLLGSQNDNYDQSTWVHSIGKRTYELSNHLGNVLSVISDKVIPHIATGTTVDYYLADILQSTDYSPFGVTLQGRNLTASGADEFRFGYQGSEMDNEVKNNGNSYTTFFRQLDPRLGRWLSIDPKASSMPWQSPYCSMDNNPILFNDPYGDWIRAKFSETALANDGINKVKEQFKLDYGLDVEFKKTRFGYKMRLAKGQDVDNLNGSAANWANVLNRKSEVKGKGVISGKSGVKIELNFLFNEGYNKDLPVHGGEVTENLNPKDQKNSIYIDLGDFNEKGILQIKECNECNVQELPESAQKSQWSFSKVAEHEVIGHGINGLDDYTNNLNEPQDENSVTPVGYVNRNLKTNEVWIRVNYSTGETEGTTTLQNKNSGESINVKYRPGE